MIFSQSPCLRLYSWPPFQISYLMFFGCRILSHCLFSLRQLGKSRNTICPLTLLCGNSAFLIKPLPGNGVYYLVILSAFLHTFSCISLILRSHISWSLEVDLLCWLRSSASQPVNPVFRLAAGDGTRRF